MNHEHGRCGVVSTKAVGRDALGLVFFADLFRGSTGWVWDEFWKETH